MVLFLVIIVIYQHSPLLLITRNSLTSFFLVGVAPSSQIPCSVFHTFQVALFTRIKYWEITIQTHYWSKALVPAFLEWKRKVTILHWNTSYCSLFFLFLGLCHHWMIMVPGPNCCHVVGFVNSDFAVFSNFLKSAWCISLFQ